MNTQELLDQMATWSLEEKAQFFVDWMMAQRDTKLKTTFFVSWMKMERGNRNFLREIADKAAAVFVTEGFAKQDCAAIEHWLQVAVDKENGLTTDQIAHTCKNSFGLPEKMIPALKRVIRIKKENKRLRDRKRKIAATGGSRPARKRPTGFTRLLADGTYSVHVSLAQREGVDLPKPAPAELPSNKTLEDPSLVLHTTIEDYEALIAPHRKLLAEIASPEVLDTLLRLLREEGNVPSVILGQGRTYDGEYTKLQSHLQFLNILQGVSLYDHSYNVLKAALEITRDDLRQRYDLLLPSIITAALAHDIGKVPSLWSSSPARMYGHEWVGVDRLKKMLISHRNEAFTESVLAAVKYHHANSKTDTIARIVTDADARAREYEITSSDPAITVKPMAEWLDIARLADIMLPAINILTIKNRKAIWNAMSFNGVVYCMPDYIRKVLTTLAGEKKVLDYRLVRNSFPNDHRSILVELAGLLQRRDLLAYTIKDSYFGLKFLFQSSIPSIPEQTFLAIPVKAELFPVHYSELEKNKTDYLKTIVSVRPVGGSY